MTWGVLPFGGLCEGNPRSGVGGRKKWRLPLNCSANHHLFASLRWKEDTGLRRGRGRWGAERGTGPIVVGLMGQCHSSDTDS